MSIQDLKKLKPKSEEYPKVVLNYLDRSKTKDVDKSSVSTKVDMIGTLTEINK